MAKWIKWNELNTLVSRRTHNKILIIWYSLILLAKVIWINILQYTNSTVIRIDKNKYEISYVINNKLFKFHTYIHKGPLPIIQIIDNNDCDVTTVVLPYLGPQFKGHGNISPTPSLMGYESLTFEMSTGDSYTFNNKNIIELNF
jgi:hypothetical protein